MASALGQMEKQEGQGLGLEEGWGQASVSPLTITLLLLLAHFISAPRLPLPPHFRHFVLRTSPANPISTFLSSSASFQLQQVAVPKGCWLQ